MELSVQISTGGIVYYRKSVLLFCVLGRLRDLQYIFAVTSGSPSNVLLEGSSGKNSTAAHFRSIPGLFPKPESKVNSRGPGVVVAYRML